MDPLRRKRKTAVSGEAHVRLYRHEHECAAYRALSAHARALLVELRALYSPKNGDNRVHCSIRRMMERCNLTQQAAQRARDELIEKGWITVVQLGGFNCKVRHATVFALENEAPNSGNGSQASKAYMRWQPAPETKKHGSGIKYLSVSDSSTDARRNRPKRSGTVSESSTEKANSVGATVSESSTQIGLPPVGGFCLGSADGDSPPLHRRIGAKRWGAA
jgi:hypothetical protein